jgi:hypothetical protein
MPILQTRGSLAAKALGFTNVGPLPISYLVVAGGGGGGQNAGGGAGVAELVDFLLVQLH